MCIEVCPLKMAEGVEGEREDRGRERDVGERRASVYEEAPGFRLGPRGGGKIINMY
jgi:hypothetical protein